MNLIQNVLVTPFVPLLIHVKDLGPSHPPLCHGILVSVGVAP